MLLPVECILDGTWASGAPPEEWVAYRLMRHMGWTWDDLQHTPPYVARYCLDFMAAETRAHNAAVERAQAQR